MAGYRRLPSGLWQATIRLPDGKRRTRTDPLKGVVKRWAEESEAALRRGEWADPQDGRITLAQWWTKWSRTRVIERATRDRDLSHWRVHVEPRWGSVKLGAITAWDVEGWLADMSRAEVGATTRAQAFRLLRHMMSAAAHHKLIATDPTATVKAPSIPRHVDRFLTEPEFYALWSVLHTDQDRGLIALMTLAGLRWAEAAGIWGERIHLGTPQPWLTVVEVKRRDGSTKPHPKSEAGMRDVPIAPMLAEALRAVWTAGPLFPTVSYTNWRRRVFVPAVKVAGLAAPLPTPHDLRHTFGSWLAQRGVAPIDIMTTMGHTSLRATERYLHAGGGRLGRVAGALEAVNA